MLEGRIEAPKRGDVVIENDPFSMLRRPESRVIINGFEIPGVDSYNVNMAFNGTLSVDLRLNVASVTRRDKPTEPNETTDDPSTL